MPTRVLQGTRTHTHTRTGGRAAEGGLSNVFSIHILISGTFVVCVTTICKSVITKEIVQKQQDYIIL